MLLIADIGNRRVRQRHFEAFDCDSAFSRAARLDDLGVEGLICGGISDFFARLIEAHRIQIISFAAGAVDDVLEAYVTGNLFEKKFRMPGCGTEDDKRLSEED